MKAIISKADAEAFIQNRFERLGTGVTAVEIQVPAPEPVSGNYVEAICRVKFEFPNYRTDQKIAAIKRLRELVPGLGLGDAKVAIENPDEAIRCFIASGRLFTYGVNAR